MFMQPPRNCGFARSRFAMNEHRRQRTLHPLIGGNNFLQLRFERFKSGAEKETVLRPVPALVFLEAG